jgi:hypothetical protein
LNYFVVNQNYFGVFWVWVDKNDRMQSY